MKSIVHKDSGEDSKGYLRWLMLEDGLIDEDDKSSGEELARDDKNHKGQKVSNKEWELPTDNATRTGLRVRRTMRSICRPKCASLRS